jgi:hypothetical protein
MHFHVATMRNVDKGGVVVVMNKLDYFAKMDDYVASSGCYRKLVRNPINKISIEVKKAIKDSNLEDDVKERMNLNFPSVPIFYGLQKIPKEGIPL